MSKHFFFRNGYQNISLSVYQGISFSETAIIIKLNNLFSKQKYIKFKLTKRVVLMFCRQLKNIMFAFQKIFTFANILGRGTNIAYIFKLLVHD